MNAPAAVASALTLVIGVVIGALVTPPLVQSLLYKSEISACWSPDIKSLATQLANKTALNIFKDTVPSNYSDVQKARLLSSFSVELSGFFAMRASPQVAPIECGAAIGYSYTNFGGIRYQNTSNHVISFIVYPSPSGPLPTMSQADLAGALICYQPGQ